MSKNFLVLTTAGQSRWLREAVASLKDPLDVLVVDDATPGDEIRDFCKEKGLAFLTKEEPVGLTNSWNMAYQYFKKHKYNNCILSNDDVRFPAGFSEGIFKALKEFDLVGQLSNNPGTGVCQDIRRFVNIEPNEKNFNKIQETISERYRKAPNRPSNFVNGFCFAFSSSIAKYAYNEELLFNPTNVNTLNEYDLVRRINRLRGKIAICKTSYVFHWKAKTTEKLNKDWGKPGDYREQLWKVGEKKSVEMKDVPLGEYVDRLKDKDYFSFVRYGDGEWKAILKGAGMVACRQQVLDSEIQSDMVRSLTAINLAAYDGSSVIHRPDIIFGMQGLGLRYYGDIISDFLRKHRLEDIKWVDADVFHFASRAGLLYPLIEQLRNMKVVVVGPSLLKGLPNGVFRYIKFIEVSEKNCYKDQAAIKSEILKAHKELKENVVYAFCCGPLAETLILDLHSQMPSNFLIDFGSLWDVFCGTRSRKYTASKKYTSDILKRNVGTEAVYEVPGWFGGEEARILQKCVMEQQKRSKSDMLEVGSWKGRSSIIIASVLAEDRRLWMVDHFEGGPETTAPKPSIFNTRHKRREKAWAFPELLENVVEWKVQNKVIILPLSSEKAASVVDEKFSLVFIDGDHRYEGVSKDCELWLPHLEKGGAIVFHDYNHPPVRKFCDKLKQNKNLTAEAEAHRIIVFRRHNV